MYYSLSSVDVIVRLVMRMRFTSCPHDNFVLRNSTQHYYCKNLHWPFLFSDWVEAIFWSYIFLCAATCKAHDKKIPLKKE